MKEKYTGSCHMTGGLLISSIMLTTSLKIAQLQSKKLQYHQDMSVRRLKLEYNYC